MVRRRFIRFVAALSLLLAGTGAQAQCAMCGSGAPYATSSPDRAYTGFAVAALVLLVPVFGMGVALGVYLRRACGVPGHVEPEAGPVDGAKAVRVLS